MKAVTYRKYGSPDVLEIQEIEKPAPRENEILIKIVAASVNPADYYILKGMGRLMGFGLINPKKQRLGADVSGIIESVGKNVSDFEPGDEVFGDLSVCGFGSFAEYVTVPADAVVKKPSNVSFEEAAAAPLASITALQGLRDKGKIHSGQKVLINGASGGVGSFAVQIAKSYETEVTGVCSTEKIDPVQSIGADHVIDYTEEDFTQNGETYNLIFDTAAHRSITDYKKSLSPGGIYILIGGSIGKILQGNVMAPILSMTGTKKFRSMIAKPIQKDLKVIRELIEDDKVKSIIDRTFPLDESANAMQHLIDGHPAGKVVIAI